MNIDVFISYHTDSSHHIVEAIVNKLEGMGIRCWYSEKYLIGGDYASGIMEALSKCRVFLLVLNKPASESAHVLNELEIVTDRLSKKENVIILPFHIADTEINPAAKYYIKRHHWIDAMNPPMQERINELAGRIQSMLEMSEPAREQKPSQQKQETMEQRPELGTQKKTTPREKRQTREGIKSSGVLRPLGVVGISALVMLMMLFIPYGYEIHCIWPALAGSTALLILSARDKSMQIKLAWVALVINVIALGYWYNFFILNRGWGPPDAFDYLHYAMHLFRFAAFAYPVFVIVQHKVDGKLWSYCKAISAVGEIVASVFGVIGMFILRFPKGIPPFGSGILILLAVAWCVFAGVAMLKEQKSK